jgi:transposase
MSSIAEFEPRVIELRTRGAGPQAIFDRIRLETPEFTGSLSAVKRVCVRLKKQEGPCARDVAIRVETKPGEVAQVDFGYVGELFDPDQGVMRRAWVFVMVLGYSRHQFAAIVFDQKVETWIDLHIRAFEFFGGVPAVIVPDNLKSAVIRAAFGVDDEAVLNRSYRELARYYGFRIDPTPPRAPQKKGMPNDN